jgi:hypothetical protein
VATRQTSSSGRPKSPRIQVVLPEDLCERLAALAEEESRTVSNMAKVLIQQGVEARVPRSATLQNATSHRNGRPNGFAPSWNGRNRPSPPGCEEHQGACACSAPAKAESLRTT